MSRVQS
jgi:hypothetical protein